MAAETVETVHNKIEFHLVRNCSISSHRQIFVRLMLY